MAGTIVTPLTQALEEGKLTREELKDLMRRSNGPAFRRLAVWVAVLAITSALITRAWDSWLVWPAMFLHGIVIVHHFSLQHECVHYTVFRTRWINDVVGHICGLIIILPHRFFRYEHCDHHTYTQLHGKDPELIEMPESIGRYLWLLSAVPYWKGKVSEILRHASGRLNETELRFIPTVEHGAVFRDARMMLAVYGALLAGMAMSGWWAPVWYWFVPLLLGEPVMRAIRLSEHVGRPTVVRMRENTRTNRVSAPWRFLSWNMNYHAEHHYAPSVPFHALPLLHGRLKDHIHVENDGYLGAHRDILDQLLRPKSGQASGHAR